MPQVLERYGDLVSVFKPAGMLVHRQGPGQRGPFLLQWVRDEVGERVHAVNRLDKPTAGMVLFAISPEAAAEAAMAFRERTTGKHYLGIVRGHLTGEDVIDYPLAPVRDKFASQSAAGSQDARTRYAVLATSELPRPVGRYQTARYSLLHLQPETGRRHQIRRHLKHIFHPLVGDRKYGDRDHNRSLEDLGFRRLALFASGLDIELDGNPVSLRCRPDGQFVELARATGLESYLSLLPL